MNKPFNLWVPEYDANKFSWKGNVGVIEASDLGTYYPIYSQCWNDSMDGGLRLYNPKTGNLVEFVLTEIKEDNDGDLTSWHVVSNDKNYPDPPDLSLIVFND